MSDRCRIRARFWIRIGTAHLALGYLGMRRRLNGSTSRDHRMVKRIPKACTDPSPGHFGQWNWVRSRLLIPGEGRGVPGARRWQRVSFWGTETIAWACFALPLLWRAGRRRGSRDGPASQRAAEWCHVMCREVIDEKDSLAKTRTLGVRTKIFAFILIRQSRGKLSPYPKTFSPDLCRSSKTIAILARPVIRTSRSMYAHLLSRSMIILRFASSSHLHSL